MKGAKELAGIVRERMEHDGGYVPVFTEDAVDILAHLDRLAAIDSAVPGEVGEIAKHHDHCFIRGAKEPENGQLLAWYRAAKIADSHRATLLAIIQRGAVALRQTIRDELLDAARAEVERIQALVDEFKAASMLDVNGDPDGVTPRLLEGHVTSLQTEVERLRTERAALAQENARLINEVGELHAKLAAPSVDMTPGMQPRAMRESAGCHAGTDGDCYWSECPQIMDGEPHKSGRSCPLCNSADDS